MQKTSSEIVALLTKSGLLHLRKTLTDYLPLGGSILLTCQNATQGNLTDDRQALKNKKRQLKCNATDILLSLSLSPRSMAAELQGAVPAAESFNAQNERRQLLLMMLL